MRLEDTLNNKIDKVFSPIKIKIIYYLYLNEFSTISSMIQHIGSNYKVISKHLNELVEMEILNERRINKIRIFNLNRENEIVAIIIKLISVLKTL